MLGYGAGHGDIGRLMSAYAMQKAIFDHIRAIGARESALDPRSVATEGYALTDDEARALRDGDVAAFHTAGVHPVLINMYCRSNGWKRADYRVLFPAQSTDEVRSVRWRIS